MLRLHSINLQTDFRQVMFQVDIYVSLVYKKVSNYDV